MNTLAKNHPELEFILPLHPNHAVKKHRDLLTHIHVLEPMKHHDFIKKLSQAKLLITDSGGLQEEGSFFNKRVIVCRETTERPEAIASGHSTLCHSPADLPMLFEEVNDSHEIVSSCPFGDGFSGKRVANLLNHMNWNS